MRKSHLFGPRFVLPPGRRGSGFFLVRLVGFCFIGFVGHFFVDFFGLPLGFFCAAISVRTNSSSASGTCFNRSLGWPKTLTSRKVARNASLKRREIKPWQ